MSHGDTITAIPEGFKCIASTADVKYASYTNGKDVWAVQFHPEVFHTVQGTQLLKNFVVGICGSEQSWSADSFVDTTVAELKAQLGDDKVILGLSGGVDSSVAAVLLHRAIGKTWTRERMTSDEMLWHTQRATYATNLILEQPFQWLTKL